MLLEVDVDVAVGVVVHTEGLVAAVLDNKITLLCAGLATQIGGWKDADLNAGEGD